MPRRPRIEVTERAIQTSALTDPRYNKRLQHPFGMPSAEVELKDKSRSARWMNAAIGTDHIWRQKQNGWDPVRLEEVSDPDQLGGYVITNGFVTRGERGQEMLMSQPKDVRAAIAMAKTRENNKNLGNPHRMKNEVVEAAGRQLSSEAADWLDGNLEAGHIGPTGGVRDSYERIERRDEAE